MLHAKGYLYPPVVAPPTLLQSTATNTRSTIETYLVKRRRTVLGPPVGKVSRHWELLGVSASCLARILAVMATSQEPSAASSELSLSSVMGVHC
jgi:hypothetical protein